MDWKEFFRFTYVKIIILIILFSLSIVMMEDKHFFDYKEDESGNPIKYHSFTFYSRDLIPLLPFFGRTELRDTRFLYCGHSCGELEDSETGLCPLN